MDSSYHLLISRINDFTRKFYLNKLLRGTIYTLSILVAAYLLLFLLIYYFTPVPLIKTLLFFSYLLLMVCLMAVLVVNPLLAYFKLKKTLTPEESAVLIGAHFDPVRDKLLNTLQLKALADLSPAQNQLILASIDQKIEELTPVPFTRAIQLRDNKKYLKYFFIPLSLIIAIAIIAPIVLREGTRSFMAYNKVVLPPAPFDFVLHSAVLEATQGDDLRLDLELRGDQLPQEVYIREGLNTFKLDKKSISSFSYHFKNLQANKTISFTAGGFTSREYTLAVHPRPSVLTMEATLNYPAYLKKKDEHIGNVGDLQVPEGTRVNWKIYTENTVKLLFAVNGRNVFVAPQNNYALYAAVMNKSQSYRITPINTFSGTADTVLHQITVVADALPVINVKETSDSLESKSVYFNGTVADDHGFSALKFVYIIRENGTARKKVSTGIPIDGSLTSTSFFYFWNLRKVALMPNQSLEYFLEVTDNDGVNGPKTVRSAARIFTPPNAQQLARQRETEQAGLKDKMSGAIKLAAEIEKESKKMGQQLPDKKNLTFDDKKEVTALLEKQKKLEAAVQEIQQEQQKNSSREREDTQMREDLADKQQQIDELFNHILDPKTKALLEKLQQLMDQSNKDQVQNELSKMTMDNKSLKNELDRMLELYKQLEFEQNVQNKIDRLHNLATQQEDLSKKVRTNDLSPAALKTEQEKYIEDFKALKKEMEQLAEKNKLLEHPNNLSPLEKESAQVQDMQKQSLENLQKNKPDKAAEKQENAAKAIADMARKLQEDNEQSASMESNLNAEELRRLLQNLLQTSFDQEQVMLAFKKMVSSDPAYVRNVQRQRVIKDNLKTIADSLSNLSKRIPQIQSTVAGEMQQINFNVDKSLENLGDRKTSEAARNQQFTMTGVNNLALMLNEALEQLEKNKQNAKQGGKGKGKQSMQQLQKMQEQLNKNMQQAKQQLEKQGNKGSVPKGMMSENFAKMAQQQQLIREALQRINREDNKDGKNGLGNLNEMVQDMKLTEKDLINKKVEEQTLLRQKQLLTKLLDADKAMREQDQEEKRQSKAGQDFPPAYLKKLTDYQKTKNTQTELLLKTPPTLNYYYKNKITDYFKSLNLPVK